MRRLKKRQPIAPDLTPLIDVVFLLLVFFMVASEFKKEKSILKLTLPTASKEVSKVEIKELFIELSATELAFKGAKTNFKALEQNIIEVKDKTQPVILKIDEKVSYKRLVKVLDLLEKHKLHNLALLTKKENK